VQTYHINVGVSLPHSIVLVHPGRDIDHLLLGFLLRLGLHLLELLRLGFLGLRFLGLELLLRLLDLLDRVVLLADVSVGLLLGPGVEQQRSRRDGDGDGCYGPVGCRQRSIHQSINPLNGAHSSRFPGIQQVEIHETRKKIGLGKRDN